MKRKIKIILLIVMIAFSMLMLIKDVRTIKGRYSNIELTRHDSEKTSYRIHYYLTLNEISEEIEINVEEIISSMPFEYEEDDEYKSIRKLSKEKGIEKEEIAKIIKNLILKKEAEYE